jgi:hypothetical protein
MRLAAYSGESRVAGRADTYIMKAKGITMPEILLET